MRELRLEMGRRRLRRGLKPLRGPACMVLALMLAGCGEVQAPTATGVCWRMISPPTAPARFQAISSGVATLDDCAAQLEAFHLEGQPTVAGAFQGYFIFIDPRIVASAPSLNGFRYPIFQPSQRREIDADLRGLIQDRNGAVPSAGDIDVERR